MFTVLYCNAVARQLYTMAITVNDWLKGDRDYFTGIQILQDHQVSAFLIKILSDGPDDYNTPKLLEEIEKLSR